jgi:hypothetical protein
MRISYAGSRGTMTPIIFASFIFVLVYVFECRRLAKEKFSRTGVGEGVFLQEESRKVSALKIVIFFFVLVRQPPVGQGLLIHEVCKSHAATHHSR